MEVEQVYYLNEAGRKMVGATKTITKNAQYKHVLMRNDIYIHYHCPVMWKNEYPIKLKDLHFIMDAVFFADNQYFFLEVDNQQKMTANKDKLTKYYKFKCSGLWQKQNSGHFPTLIFYTVSEHRKNQLLELTPDLNLIILTKKDLL